MPLYDFQCRACGRVVERLYSTYAAMLNDPDSRCGLGDCDGTMRVLPSAPAFHISGFTSKNGYSGGQEYEVKTADKNVRVVVKS